MNLTVEQNVKLHIAYMLKAMELLQNRETSLDRTILTQLIEEHRHALSGSLAPASLKSYSGLKRVYQRLCWYRHPKLEVV